MKNEEIQWMHYQTKDSGSEIGKLCRIGEQTFIVPTVTASIYEISEERIDAEIKKLINENKSGTYQLTGQGGFTIASEEYWRKALEDCYIGVLQ